MSQRRVDCPKCGSDDAVVLEGLDEREGATLRETKTLCSDCGHEETQVTLV